ncbi:HNH endonuclease signature motif containing protein [Aeoliella sp.]|uniref:HNH endonuclease signature motif containing protein n=1 Tax=Aeoliella sp. TaxID=2795800 RepID=UPI003CCC41CF
MPTKVRELPIPSPADRAKFWAKVSVVGECWEWQGARINSGYGIFYYQGRSYLAHRVAKAMSSEGQVTTGLSVCHRCDNPLCVRPSHLFAGSHAANMADKGKKRRCNSPKGTAQPQAKITEADVPLIHELRRQGMTTRQLSERFGLNVRNIQLILAGKCWKHAQPSEC